MAKTTFTVVTKEDFYDHQDALELVDTHTLFKDKARLRIEVPLFSSRNVAKRLRKSLGISYAHSQMYFPHH